VPIFGNLERVQQQREFPAKMIQAVLVAAQNRLLAPALAATRAPEPPPLLRILNNWPWPRQFRAGFAGLGVRPEHVRLRKS
jgi:hypothetical protein